ncbi:MAG: hypothetical protein IT428_31590 [Planctomycetaceae bacterium]|nr:hypothetical protein [Planctomycetaceae bacterium]
MIRYAGVNLLLEEPDGELATWLERYLPLDDLRLFGPSFGPQSPLWQARGASCRHLGVPTINYPAMPRLRINSLYWPQGATRWAYGVFLTDDDGLTSILEEVQSETGAAYNPAQLAIADADFAEEPAASLFSTDAEGRSALSTEMFLLQPRPISATTEQRLWLLPLVDERYFWQWSEAAFVTTDTWTNLISELSDALDADILTPSIDADFGTPDQTEVSRSWQNAAVLLDAVAASIGKRVVRDCGSGAVSLQASDAAYTLATDDLSACLSERVSGGEADQGAAASVATTVTTVFRNDAGGTEVIVENASDYEVTKTNGRNRTFHVPSIDPFTGATPTAESSALAVAIADAYYGFSKLEYDVSHVGIQPWTGNAFDDFALFAFGVRLPDGSYQAITRACSMPPNVGVDVLLNRADSQENADECTSELPILDACSAEDWGAYETFTANLTDANGDATGETKTVKAIGIAGLTGTRGTLIPRQGQDPPYEFWPKECTPSCGSA